MLLDREFHRTISSMTKNPFLEAAMNNYQDLSMRLIFVNRVSLSSIDDMDVRHHEEIYRLIRDQDSEGLCRAQKKHVQDFKAKFI